jgi:DNA-binding CsgD family transcriptional regulator
MSQAKRGARLHTSLRYLMVITGMLFVSIPAAFGLWTLSGLTTPDVFLVDHTVATSILVHSRWGTRANSLRSAIANLSASNAPETEVYNFVSHHLSRQQVTGISLNWPTYLLTILQPPKRCSVNTSVMNEFVPIEERFVVDCYHANSDSTTSFTGEQIIISIYASQDDSYQLLHTETDVSSAITFVESECPVFVTAERWFGNRLLWGQYTHYSVCHPATQSVNLLTTKEQKVLHLLKAGKSNKQIASQLGVAPETVKKHLSHIYQKLGVTNRTQATSYAGVVPQKE